AVLEIAHAGVEIDATNAECGASHQEDVALSGYAIDAFGDQRVVDEAPAHAAVGIRSNVVGAKRARGVQVHGADVVLLLGPEGEPVILGSIAAAPGVDPGETPCIVGEY